MKVKDALTQQEKVKPTQRLRPEVGFVPVRLRVGISHPSQLLLFYFEGDMK
ncbi:hypothetical protein [Paenibacillus cellulositrophicus]|uniref:hypothetical protein n=1 Tax=Paenibacillus cellulositrophicus TaxID=562959 RepID=UPI00142EF033|nr:hypothetical protein [Paenibacillus cellulositrophicus]